MNKPKIHKNISLYKWIWQSYLHTALIPLILIELIFVFIYFSSNIWSQGKSIDFFKEHAQDELQYISNKEADLINSQLLNITNSVILLSNQMEHALSTTADFTEEDLNRLTYSDDGYYFTKEDTEDGGASIFYSGLISKQNKNQLKVAQVLTQQKLMTSIKNTQPLATSIYFNTFDSLNITYPYSNSSYKNYPLLDITSYNFYYEADTEHNPDKKVIWTDIYLDPAGKGLITSALCPVYKDGFLEGVVGIDLTVNNIINQILSMHVPWDGYGMLITDTGNICALQDAAANDLGISKLSEVNFDKALSKDNLYSKQYNISEFKDLLPLEDDFKKSNSGFLNLTVNGNSKYLSWSTISHNNCKLLLIIPEKNIYSQVDILKYDLIEIGFKMVSGLIISYIIFFFFLYKKAHKSSYFVANSLLEINNMVEKISNGDYRPKEPNLTILELNNISNHLANMGQNLGETTKNLLLTQSELRKKENDLKALVNSINDIILEVDSNGVIKNIWSRSHHSLYKAYIEGELTSISDILDSDTTNVAKEKIQHVIKTKKTSSLEYTVTRNSELMWFQACISAHLNYPDMVVVSARNITIQKKMEQSLILSKEESEKANKAKSQFLSNMSHELRTPLNAILGFSQILELDTESPLTPCQKESVNEISNAGNHLLELINEVLDLSKIEAGKMSISIESVQIKPIMEESISIIKPFADRYGIEITTSEIINSNDFVSADHTRLKQVLLNLLTNAVKYNKTNGSVKFYYDKNGDNYRFHVVDTGIGLSSSELDLIFKPFNRLNRDNNAIEGTGIGLTVAKQLVELMNGKISVESIKGSGSHFWIELPSAVPSSINDVDSIIPMQNQNSFADGKLYNVLYVEDNSANLKLVERILSRIDNIKMLTATSGELCIDIAISHKPDLILLDINLPGMNGYEVLKILKAHDETSDIPIVAISANAMPRDIQKGFSRGFTDYITKPINIPNFIDKISNILTN